MHFKKGKERQNKWIPYRLCKNISICLYKRINSFSLQVRLYKKLDINNDWNKPFIPQLYSRKIATSLPGLFSLPDWCVWNGSINYAFMRK